MCFLEALACGLPVIAPAWGGQADFLNGQNAQLVAYEVVRTRGEEYEKPAGKNFLALPDVACASRLMREVFEKRKTRSMPRKRLFPSPRYFWWETIAREFLEWLGDPGGRSCRGKKA
jgi:glycosyltransferase involved in cell wall biosynthesis